MIPFGEPCETGGWVLHGGEVNLRNNANGIPRFLMVNVQLDDSSIMEKMGVSTNTHFFV